MLSRAGCASTAHPAEPVTDSPRRRPIPAGPLLTASLLALLSSSVVAGSEAADFFETRIRPLLAKNCFACHTDTQMGGLRLDARQNILQGGSRGPAIKPGSPQDSLLIQAVTQSHPELKMPPQGKLTPEQIEDLRAWIRDGAVWPEAQAAMAEQEPEQEYVIRPEYREFWSFQPVRKPETPRLDGDTWSRTDLDRFILEQLEQQDLRPGKRASKRMLIRRATLDLTGLPPTPKEVDNFVADSSPDAFAKVVDRLLDSPHYGERWGRYWLDLARYGAGVSSASRDSPYPHAYRYRDWVIDAFNRDMPYARFVKAQLAADLFPEDERVDLLPALGFHALSNHDVDRVDVTGRVFMGLTLGCAQCHDHKYDPIPTKDFYSLQGVFSSSRKHQYPLASDQVVQAYNDAKKRADDKKIEIDEFLKRVTDQLIDIFMTQTADYMTAAWRVMEGGEETGSVARETSLDEEILKKWVAVLNETDRDHPFLDEWDQNRRGATPERTREMAERFQETLLAIHKEKREMDDVTYVRLGGAKGARNQGNRTRTPVEFIDPVKYYLWEDVAIGPHYRAGLQQPGGVYFLGPDEIERMLNPAWVRYLDRQEAELKALEEAVPPLYPYIHGYRDSDEPKDLQIAIRGDKENLGPVAPRRFLRILSRGEPKPFAQGSGRWELAAAIASPGNPLTARVMVNRIWQHHFGRGIVTSASNFGRLGERPTHPELLDYLAVRFVESGWSVKSIHREMMMSATYQLSSGMIERNYEKDAENRYYWRFNMRKRLDAEALRDSMLAVAGNLDRTQGGPGKPLDDENHRRAVYGLVSRTQPNRMLTLFDFPDARNTASKRSVTMGPLQRLYFLNNSFVVQQAERLAERVEKEAGADHARRIRRSYELLYARPATNKEVKTGLKFLKSGDTSWTQYAQMLLASSEFTAVR